MRVKLDEAGAPIQEKTDCKTGRVYRYPVAAGKVPEDVWTDIETLNRSDCERTGWPSQKPERLLTRLLVPPAPRGPRRRRSRGQRDHRGGGAAAGFRLRVR